MLLIFIIWFVLAYIVFSGSLCWWQEEYKLIAYNYIVSDIVMSLMLSVCAPFSLLLLFFLTDKFKYGFNWYKSLKSTMLYKNLRGGD